MSEDSAKPVGRPPLYSDPLVMEAKCDQYFDLYESGAEREGRIPTVPGLCRFLGFASRFSFLDYEKKPEFTHTIKKARLRLEEDRAERLMSRDTPTAGVIFDLTNNHGWKNPQHMKHSQDEDGEPVKVHTITRTIVDPAASDG